VLRPRHRPTDDLSTGARALLHRAAALHGFSALGNPLQLFALASLFISRPVFMGQAGRRLVQASGDADAHFSAPDSAASSPGFSWPREAIPELVLAAGHISSDFAIDASSASTSWARAVGGGARLARALVLAIIYFALAVMSALLFKRRQVNG